MLIVIYLLSSCTSVSTRYWDFSAKSKYNNTLSRYAQLSGNYLMLNRPTNCSLFMNEKLSLNEEGYLLFANNIPPLGTELYEMRGPIGISGYVNLGRYYFAEDTLILQCFNDSRTFIPYAVVDRYYCTLKSDSIVVHKYIEQVIDDRIGHRNRLDTNYYDDECKPIFVKTNIAIHYPYNWLKKKGW